MLDAHAHVMQVKLCKANTRGVTAAGDALVMVAVGGGAEEAQRELRKVVARLA